MIALRFGALFILVIDRYFGMYKFFGPYILSGIKLILSKTTKILWNSWQNQIRACWIIHDTP